MYIIVKSSEKDRYRSSVLKSFGVNENATAEQKEAAEVIIARTAEITNGGNNQ